MLSDKEIRALAQSVDAEKIDGGALVLPKYKGTKNIVTTGTPPELNGERGCYLEELTAIGAFVFAGDISNRLGNYYTPLSVQSTSDLRNEYWLKPLLEGKFILNGGLIERTVDRENGVVYQFYNNPSVFSVDMKLAACGMYTSVASDEVSTIPELLQELGVINDSNKITTIHELDNINEYGEQFGVLLSELHKGELRVFFALPMMYGSNVHIVLERFSDSPLNFSHYPPRIQCASHSRTRGRQCESSSLSG